MRQTGTVTTAVSKRVPAARCMVILGTRPEAVKLFPVIRALQGSWVKPYVVNTGQHADMVRPVLDMAGVTIDANLELAREGQTINTMVRDIVGGVDGLLDRLRGGPERRASPRLFGGAGTSSPYPAAVMVHGDTTTALAGALAAAGVKIPVLHVEAGLRTGDAHSPFPEELNRQLIARIAAFHFAPITANEMNLVREGLDERRIFVSGNTGLDALRFAAGLEVPWTDPRVARVDDHEGAVIVATAHRRENWGEGLQGIAAGLATIAERRPDALIVVPMHPNPRVREQLSPGLADRPNVILTDAMDYAEFAHLLQVATLAISDSGGVQEEAPAVGTPVLVTRSASERMEGVAAGTLKLVGTDPDLIAGTTLELLNDPAEYQAMVDAVNPFGDGHASERIVAAIEHMIFNTPSPQPFGPGFDRREVLAAAGYSRSEVDRALTWAEGLPRH